MALTSFSLNPLLNVQQNTGVMPGIQQQGLIRQNQAEQNNFDATQSFNNTAQAQGLDLTNEDGVRKAVQALILAGHADKAMDIYQQFQAANSKQKFQALPQGSFDNRTGQVTPWPTDVNEGPKMQLKDTPSSVIKSQNAGEKDKAFMADLPKYSAAAASIGTDQNKLNDLKTQITAEHGDSPAAQKYLTGLKAQAVPGNTNQRLIGSYLTDYRNTEKPYNTISSAYLALKGIKNSSAYGTGLGDQSMIDKLIMIETGKVPTEAQYFQMAQNLGIGDKIDKITGRLKTGEILGPTTRQNLENEAEEQMKIAHNSFKDAMGQQSDAMTAAGINPKTVVRPGGNFNAVDKYLQGAPAAAQTAKGPIAQPKTKAEFDALKSGDHWIDSKGAEHIKK